MTKFLAAGWFFGWLLASSLALAEIQTDKLESGDLIFVEAQNSGVSGAINRSTQVTDWRFSHVAMVEREQQAVYVLHATGERGSVRQPLAEFMQQRGQKGQQVQVFRLQDTYKKSISVALKRAHMMLGKPYNQSYILNEDSYYCSDYVERAFRPYAIFEHIPMNFKDPATGEIDTIWVERYAQLGQPVPQDKPGTNPNQLAASPKLTYLGAMAAKSAQ